MSSCCRHEFYQKPEEVVVTIFAKGVPAKNVTVDYGEQIVCFLFLFSIGSDFSRFLVVTRLTDFKKLPHPPFCCLSA